jgi:hypothetical protein
MLKKILILFVALGALVGGTLVAPSFEIRIGSVPAPAALDVKARDLTLACPGALFKAGGAKGTTLGNFEHVGNVSYVSQFNSVNGETVASRDGVFEVTAPSGSSGGVSNQGSQLLNASQFQNAAGATLRGLAAANCQLPTNDIWLLGGSTTTGREALLILRNTSQVDSTVSLEIFSEAGSVDAPGLNGIAVVAGKTTVVPLSGVVPKTKSFAVHVTANGGAIAAWIQQRTVRGLTAGGVDYVSPSPEVSKQQVIPGVFIRGTAQAAKLRASSADYADLVPVLRIFVPGKSNATVTAQILGANATTFGTVVRSNVNAGSVSDLEIPGLKDGNYVALISSDVDVQSSIRLSRVTATAGPDFTWIPAAQKFTGKRNLTIPSAGISKLCVYNDKTGAIDVIEVTPGSTYSFSGSSEPIYANLITDINGTLANLSVLDQKNAGGKVSVNVR